MSIINELEVAIKNGGLKRVCTLLDGNPELLEARFTNNVGMTPLMWACRNRRAEIVAELLERDAAVNVVNIREANGDGGNTALWFTAQGEAGGTVPIARMLLDTGAKIDQRCEEGTTAFHLACAWVHFDLVQFLVARGADFNLANDKGQTPLSMMKEDLAWCEEQALLNYLQRRFLVGAPQIIRYLQQIPL